MKKSPYHGFTLIEIIVSITLLLLLSGFFIAGYNRFNDTQKVQQAASTLVRNLQAVRTKAASGNKPAGCDTLVGYTVTFTADTYTSRALCRVGAVGEINTYTLPTDVTISAVPSTITFYALDRGASANQTITITDVGNTKTVNVSVFTSGVVSDVVP
ncbi:MAG: type II secretion system protein [Candidatus Gottesmanbacteria bacterium]|nr:type II secretion system protein [Candidatus Gottesmanbacteria bacterium]